jgi:hypothetical protein
VSRACAWLLAASLAVGCSRPSKQPGPTFTDNAAIEAGARSPCCENRERRAELLDAAVEASPVERSVEAVIAPEERFVAAASCAREVRAKKPLERSLAELGRSCAQGMSPLVDLVRASTTAGESIEARFSLTAGAICLRAGAVASSGALLVSLVNPRGETLVSVRSSTPLDLLPNDGPICVREPGSYRVTARLVSTGADPVDVALQVWNAGQDR